MMHTCNAQERRAAYAGTCEGSAPQTKSSVDALGLSSIVALVMRESNVQKECCGETTTQIISFVKSVASQDENYNFLAAARAQLDAKSQGTPTTADD